MTDEKATIAANIQRIRKEQGLSQTALANEMQAAGATHWRQTTVSRVEQGKQEIRFDEIEALGAVLGPEVFEGTPLTPTPEMQETLRHVRDSLVDRHLAKVEAALTAATSEVQQLRAAMRGTWRQEFTPGEAADEGDFSFNFVPSDADLGEHVETIEVLPLDSEMPGPSEASVRERSRRGERKEA